MNAGLRVLAAASLLSATGCIVPASAPGIVAPHHVRLARVQQVSTDPPDQRYDRWPSTRRQAAPAPVVEEEEAVLVVTPWQTGPTYTQRVDAYGQPYIQRTGFPHVQTDCAPVYYRRARYNGHHRYQRARRFRRGRHYRRGFRDGYRRRGYRDGYRRRGYRRYDRRPRRYRRGRSYDRRRW